MIMSPSRSTQRRTLSPNASPNISQIQEESTLREKTMGEKRSSMIGSVEKSMSNSSMDGQRAPMLSPSRGHKDYNRFKYYSALRTGYGHLGQQPPELEPPTHVIDETLFLFKIPFGKSLPPFCEASLTLISCSIQYHIAARSLVRSKAPSSSSSAAGRPCLAPLYAPCLTASRSRA